METNKVSNQEIDKDANAKAVKNYDPSNLVPDVIQLKSDNEYTQACVRHYDTVIENLETRLAHCESVIRDLTGDDDKAPESRAETDPQAESPENK